MIITKKILILANNDIGLYNFRKELIEKLIAENFDVYISLPYGKKVDYLVNMGCKFVDTPIDRRGINPISDLKLLFTYKKILRKLSPDVVLTYTIKPNIYGGMACRLNKTPYISNITGLGSALEKGGIIKKFVVMLYKIAFAKVQCVFFENTACQQFFLTNNIKIKKGEVLPGAGVNCNEYAFCEYPDDSEIKFLFVGRVMKEKGIDEFLDSAKIIKENYPEAEFHIVGMCEEKTYLDKLKKLEESNTIFYHGEQEDVKPFYKSAHCIVLPSYHEGMANVLLEAAAIGRPIITSDIPGCRESVSNNVTGYLVEPKNCRSLTEAMTTFLRLDYCDRKKMGLLARKKIEQEFDRKMVIEKTMLLL